MNRMTQSLRLCATYLMSSAGTCGWGGKNLNLFQYQGSLVDIMNNKVASGAFPDIIDNWAVTSLAIEQNLVMDLKPYIDEKKLQDNVGSNYTKYGKTENSTQCTINFLRWVCGIARYL